MTAMKSIRIRGAKEHNLRSVDLDIPRDRLVVFTGVSGSGKSSLAFDTIYAEGQRRYVESLSAYARQFLGQMEKPHVDFIDGLSPAISIEQKSAGKNPRSTVGTVTEVYDYLRLLFSRCGTPYCPDCGEPIGSQTVDQIVDQIGALDAHVFLLVLVGVPAEGGDDLVSGRDQLANEPVPRERTTAREEHFHGKSGLPRRRQLVVRIEIGPVPVLVREMRGLDRPLDAEHRVVPPDPPLQLRRVGIRNEVQ